MSHVYSTEPPTTGKVILVTNFGNIDIELWTKEAPRACRNFLQLCMEGYYTNCVFFRILKGFMIQTGDPTNTGKGGESVWGKEFADEFHSRLKFSHRGIVAMANRNTPNSNSSQFFITMDKCSWLDKKHTIFGKVTGQTIFNALAIGDLATKNDFPDTDTLPLIIKVEILINPFEDIQPRKKEKRNVDLDSNLSLAKSLAQFQKQEKMKNTNLISFEDEEENNYDNLNLTSKEEDINENLKSTSDKFKIKPIHEIIKNDRKLVNKSVNELESGIVNNKLTNLKKRLQQINKHEKKENLSLNDDNNNFTQANKTNLNNDESSSSSDSESEDNKDEKLNLKYEQLTNIVFDNERKNEILQLKQDIKDIKKRLDNPSEFEEEDESNKPMSALQRHQAKFLNIKKKRDYTTETIQQIEKFKDKLKVNKMDKDNWMSNKLKFHVDSQKAYTINETNEKMKKNFGQF